MGRKNSSKDISKDKQAKSHTRKLGRAQRKKTNYIKARIDKTQQNSKNRLYGDRDETTNHIISERSKLTQKEYKTRHDGVGKVVHWELCKKLKLDLTNKWYMQNPESETHKLPWDFEIQTDHLISASRPDRVIVKKKENLLNCELRRTSRPQNKTERKRKEK